MPDANGNGTTGIAGAAEAAGPAGTELEIQFYKSRTCSNSEPPTFGAPRTVTTNANGVAGFALLVPLDVNVGDAIRATARFPGGSESGFSNCVIADRNNTSWPTAFPLDANDTDTANYLRSSGQARWFKVPIVPNSRVDITASNLPADYDLVVFGDVAATYDRLVHGAAPNQSANLALDDLTKQGADTPVDLFNTSQYNPSSWDPTNWKPTLNDNVFTTQFSPTEYSPTEYSAAFTAPTEYSPTEYSPTEYSPTEYSPTEYSPTEYSADQFSRDAWASFNPADPRAFYGRPDGEPARGLRRAGDRRRERVREHVEQHAASSTSASRARTARSTRTRTSRSR